MLGLLVPPALAAAQPQRVAALPENVEKKSVTIWSDGTRMAGDLYLPKDRKPDQKLPAVVFCNGTGGTKGGTGARLAPRFVERGFAFLAFDYRGWGESDSRLMLVEPMPKPDEKGEVNVRARAIRWQMDAADQTFDIRAAIDYLAGEPNVDPQRIGIMGSSYGGGLVTWVAAHDPRVKCVVAQVPGMGGARGPAGVRYAYGLATKQARGEVEPVPIETGKLQGQMARYAQMRANPAKGRDYNPVADASRITAPTLIVVAEKEELMDNAQNGRKVFEVLEARGGVPVAYHEMKGISHYGIYREGFEEATKLELDWFATHLRADRKPE
jgi:dipeptidyl aminopeptidase/acylaminoacyl peptidase